MPEFKEQLNDFIVRAKAVTYVGSGVESASCRPSSHDLEFQEGDFRYLDSYFGGADFIGEEAVYFKGKPVWAMNYYGRILAPESISGEDTGKILKKSLSQLYRENRFLGGYKFIDGKDTYIDTNEGNLDTFTGIEWIEREGVRVYELIYHGGLIK
jgi:hypothetical protein